MMACTAYNGPVVMLTDTPHYPLITYTNHVRNLHNWNSTEAFAKLTGQEFAIYYAEDTVHRVGHKVVLSGQNAIDAWNTPIKDNAKDISGCVPLVVGMPIFVVDNITVELGISKSSGGTLIGVKYELRHGRRYAISVDVEIPVYTTSDSTAEHPHRLTLRLISVLITYKQRHSEVIYSASRHQVPIIPGVAHHSHSRSIDAGVVHLESCKGTAAAYVMLSRIKCDEGGPTWLAILGKIDPKQISTHAPEQVRAEEKRLQALARQTLIRTRDTLSWYTELTGEQF